MRQIFEAMPIILAVIGFAASIERAFGALRKDDRAVFTLQAICCGLLALAQSSWFMSLLAGFDHDTKVTDYTWTVFNSLVAITFTAATWNNKHR